MLNGVLYIYEKCFFILPALCVALPSKGGAYEVGTVGALHGRNRHTVVGTYQSKQFCRVSVSGNLQNIFSLPVPTSMQSKKEGKKEIDLLPPSKTKHTWYLRDLPSGEAVIRYFIDR